MAEDKRIGQYVQRIDIDRVDPRGKFHLVQSIIADDAITKCGRRMKDSTIKNIKTLKYAPASGSGRPWLWQMCEICEPTQI